MACACFVGAATYWWARGKSNAWGPEATIGLPAYAAATSAVIVYKFLTATPLPEASVASQVEEEEA
jgi:hypothetical protein